MHRHASAAVLLTIVATFLAPQPCAAAKSAPLGFAQVIPDDVILYVAERPNPERDFIRAYWHEVLGALVDSGVPSDLLAMLGDMLELEEEQQSELARLETRFRELAAGVDWSALGAMENAFAERLAFPQELRPDPFMGTPDMVWLARGTAQSAAQNADGMAEILQALAEEVNAAVGKDVLAVTRSERLGARITTLEPVEGLTRMRVSVASRNELIMLGFGEGLFDQVLQLAAAKKPKKSPSLANSARFQAAFQGLPAPEDMLTYFDMQSMLGDIRGFVAKAMAKAAEPRDRVVNTSDDAEAMALYGQASERYGEGDVAGALELTRKAHEIAPGDPRILYNIACFEALSDNPAEAVVMLGKAVEAGFHSPGKIAADPDLESIRETEGYRAAHARAAELARTRAAEWLDDLTGLVDRLLAVPGIVDHVASVSYTDGFSTYTETTTKLVDGAADHPFYPVLAGATSSGDFAAFLPREAVSFSVSAGIDLEALVTFIEDTVRSMGSTGEEAMKRWQALQAEWEFDLRRDLVAWIEGSMITVTLDEGEGSAWLIGVSDEAKARETVQAALDAAAAKLAEVAEQNPAAAMINLRRAPAADPALEGFESVFVGMSPKPLTWGVARGHLMLGTEQALVACLQTAGGEHPSIRENERVMKEMLAPKAAGFSGVSVTDRRQLGKQLATAMGIASMVGAMMGAQVEDAEARQVLADLVGLIPRLTPVVKEINFFRSTASRTSFDGAAWHSTRVTHYKAPPPPEAEPEPEQPIVEE